MASGGRLAGVRLVHGSYLSVVSVMVCLCVCLCLVSLCGLCVCVSVWSLCVCRGREGDLSSAVNLEIVDVEKIKGLFKYYVRITHASTLTHKTHSQHTHTNIHTQLYIIHVTCKDGGSHKIRRRYKQFDDVQNALEKRFPIEAGSIKSTDRTLPILPGV